jgi:hypothetical protein
MHAFQLSLTFLNATIQKTALEIHDYQTKTRPPPTIHEVEKQPEINVDDPGNALVENKTNPTLLVSRNDPQSKQTPPRGELDQAIRSMRQGVLGKRMGQAHSIRLSKIFVDGSNTRHSHIYD